MRLSIDSRVRLILGCVVGVPFAVAVIGGLIYRALQAGPFEVVTGFVSDAVNVASMPGADAASFDTWLLKQHGQENDLPFIRLTTADGRNVLEFGGVNQDDCKYIVFSPPPQVVSVAVAVDLPALETTPMLDAESNEAYTACKNLKSAGVALVLRPTPPIVTMASVAAGAQRLPGEVKETGEAPARRE